MNIAISTVEVKSLFIWALPWNTGGEIARHGEGGMTKEQRQLKEEQKYQNKVWAVYPNATYWGVDAKKNFPGPFAACEVYESDDLDAPVIGEGDSYLEAWKDAASRLPKRKAKKCRRTG
jgi:hypothetical protein